MIICHNCGTKNQPGSSKCRICMNALGPSEPTVTPKRGGSSMNPTVIISLPQDQPSTGGYGSSVDLSIPPLDDDDSYSMNVGTGLGQGMLHDEFDTGLDNSLGNSIGLDLNPRDSSFAEGLSGHWSIPTAPSQPQTNGLGSVCPVCHAENLPEYYYCLHCGSKLRASSALPKSDKPVSNTTTIMDEQPSQSSMNPPIAPSWSDQRPDRGRAPAPVPSNAQPLRQTPAEGRDPNAEKTLVIGSISTKPKGRLTMITEDGSSGETYELGDQTVIGRTTGDISFPYDGYMSGRHASIVQRGGSFILKDENSSNGTFIKIRGEVELKPGDVILIGRELFKFEA